MKDTYRDLKEFKDNFPEYLDVKLSFDYMESGSAHFSNEDPKVYCIVSYNHIRDYEFSKEETLGALLEGACVTAFLHNEGISLYI